MVELLRWVGLGDRMNALPPVLSGGEKQRAAIARALIVRPELLLADEPTGNVDPGLARRLLRLFVELHKSGTAVVIATHDLALMDQFGDARRLVVGDGQLRIFEGESRDDRDAHRAELPQRFAAQARHAAGAGRIRSPAARWSS